MRTLTAGRLDRMQALRRWRDLLVRVERGARCVGGCPLGTLSTEIAEIVPEFRVDLNRAFNRWEDGIRSGLRAMYARGALRKDTDRSATALHTMLDHIELLTKTRWETS